MEEIKAMISNMSTSGGGGGGSTVVAKTSRVAGATEAKAMSIDGTNWNFPEGGEPDAYLKSVAYTSGDNEATFTKKDDSTVSVPVAVADDSTLEVDATSNKWKVKDNGITASKIANVNITAAKIADGNVTTAKIAAGAVVNSKIGAKAVNTAKIDDDAVTNGQLADNAVQTENIKDANVTNAKIAADAVTNAKIADDAVQEENIADNAVTSTKVANSSITNAKIADGAVDTNKLGSDAVTNAKVADNAIQTENIVNLNVTTDKLAADAVTNTKLADDAVQTENIKDANVTKAKLASDCFEDDAFTGDTTIENLVVGTSCEVPTPTANEKAANKQYVDDSIAAVSGGAFTFKGWVSSTAPAGSLDIREGNLWYEGTTMPTAFPIQVKKYTSGAWSTTTQAYTANALDMWSDINAAATSEIYYFNGQWKPLDPTAVQTDNSTIGKDTNNKLQVKDSGITTGKIASSAITKEKISTAAAVVYETDSQTLTNKTIDADSNTLSNIVGGNLKNQASADAKKTWVVQSDGTWALGKAGSDVDNVTIEESSDKLQVKDGGISFAKLKSDATIVSTDSTTAESDTNIYTAKKTKETYEKKIVYSDSAPTAHDVVWCNTSSDNLLERWNSATSSWETIGGDKVKVDNETIKVNTDGELKTKIRIWEQADEPDDAVVGDLWIDDDDVANDFLKTSGGTMTGNLAVGDSTTSLAMTLNGQNVQAPKVTTAGVSFTPTTGITGGVDVQRNYEYADHYEYNFIMRLGNIPVNTSQIPLGTINGIQGTTMFSHIAVPIWYEQGKPAGNGLIYNGGSAYNLYASANDVANNTVTFNCRLITVK